ncbi:MAG TPA: hypothetical protein DDY39_11840 [Nitrospira sp.]|nr:hypothetical protein [Nitrospira sp.]
MLIPASVIASMQPFLTSIISIQTLLCQSVARESFTTRVITTDKEILERSALSEAMEEQCSTGESNSILNRIRYKPGRSDTGTWKWSALISTQPQGEIASFAACNRGFSF